MDSTNSGLYAVNGDRRLQLEQDVDLRYHSTMRVGGSARFFAEANSIADVECAYNWAAERDISVYTIGSGSNIIWSDTGFSGLVLKNNIRGFQILSRQDNHVEIRLGAGEILDEVVERITHMGLTGMECLSLIPGTCGGSIVQNSGAYGQEISQVLQSVDVFDTTSRKVVALESNACNLGYRSSRFKDEEPGRHVILGFTVKLQTGPANRTTYPALLAMLGDRSHCSSAEMRAAVISIRESKLPNPAMAPNCGSFFTNPVLLAKDVNFALRNKQAPLHLLETGEYKVPAAWLIEHSGFKDHNNAELGFGTWATQPLVIYGTRQSSCTKLQQYSDMVKRAVLEKFGVKLVQEPVLVGC
jgi:UDP-N-acetylmuramate dehydrogenase